MSAFEKLTLNGYTYPADELLHLCEQKIRHGDADDDEFALYEFIQQWLSPSEFIEVSTSGSTGTPTIMTLEKRQFIESAEMTCNYFGLREGLNMLLCLSAEYIAGKMMVVRAFVSGANLFTVPPSGNPLEGIEQKIDFTAMVPLQVQNTIADPATSRIFSYINNVIIGGAALSPKLQHELESFPNHIYSTFAMTETLSHIALKRLNGPGKKDLYELLNGITVAEDDRGCMVINAPHLSPNPIVTNDIIVKTDNKHFHWLGRFDNVINSGGVKIYPESIEEKLAPLFPSNRFFITSLPDDTLGQKVVMVIEDSSSVDAEKLNTEIEKLIGKFEVPKEYFTIAEFAETATGKIQRQETLRKVVG
jgi:O-succinylbenzoic acid--CoA ligase